MSKPLFIATSRELPDLPPHDRPLLLALEDRAVPHRIVFWDDPAIDWSNAAAVLPKSPWDYPQRWFEFEQWLVQCGKLTKFINPLEVILWNYRKSYLKALEASGVPTIPSLFLGDAALTVSAVESWMRSQGTADFILKPIIGGSAYNIRRVSRDDVDSIWGHAGDHAEVEFILQPFVPEITSIGETSLIVIDGVPSIAVLKLPKAGEFRSQYFHGASEQVLSISDAHVGFARSVLAAVPWSDLAYARIDFIETSRGPLLVELELIEPALFLDLDPTNGSAVRLAARLERDIGP